MLDQVLIPIGGFACARLQALSAYLAHRAGSQTLDGVWSIGLVMGRFRTLARGAPLPEPRRPPGTFIGSDMSKKIGATQP
jgi:hypothetical protein